MTYLQSRPEVDPDRIGCVGLSYGGTMTLFTTAMDEPIKCAVVSCYLSRIWLSADVSRCPCTAS
ncbi:MAG: prolyl oligopeptidase family serine peptidase [SAR202 cluster bacterium]|nr:prolyl oligopeptidase family serine peptidase [SAR202 cluster bacterium]